MKYIRKEKEIHTAFRYNGENAQDIEKILADTNLVVSFHNDYVLKISRIGEDAPKYRLGHDAWAIMKSGSQIRLLHKFSFHQEFKPTNKPYKYLKKEHKVFNAVQYTGDNVQEIENLLMDTNISILSYDDEQIMFDNPDTGSSKGFVRNDSWVIVKRQSALLMMSDEVFKTKFVEYME